MNQTFSREEGSHGSRLPGSAWLPGFALWLTIGLLVGFLPVVRHGWQGTLAVSDDAWLTSFLLEHAREAVAGGPAPLWRPPMFHPFPESGALSETLFGVLPFYSPGRWLGASPLAAGLQALALMSVATFALAFVLFRRGLDASPLEAGFAAFVVAFGSAKMSHVHHLQVFAQVPLFLALVLAQRALLRPDDERARLYAIALSPVLVAAQFYSCAYVVLLALLLAAVLALLLTGFARERRALVDLLRGRRVAGLGGIAAIGGALLAALLLLPAFRHYLAAAGTVQRYPAAKLAELLPPPLALLNSGEGSWLGRPFSLWTGIPAQPFAGEFELGAGFVATGLALVGLAAARRPWLGWILAGSAVAWILLVRWPGGFSVWGAAMERFPALGLLRAVSRLHLLLLPGIAAATLLGLRAARRRWGPVAAAVLCAVVVAEQVRVWEPREIPATISPAAVAAALPDDCAAFFLSSFGERKFNTSLQLAAMWTALETGVPTVNGYSGYFPRGWKLYPSHEPQPSEGDLRVRLDRWLARHEFSGELCWLRYSPAEPERALIVEKFRRP